MPANVDLRTTILPDDHRNWKVFPGEGYKFLLQMIDSRAVFMDVRDLNDVGNDPREWDEAELLEHISLDRWTRQNADRAPADRTRRHVSQADHLNLTLVKGLFQTAKKGDLVLVPHPNSTGAISIGQFLDDPGRVELLEIVDDDDGVESTYVGRRVKWLPQWSKRFASDELVGLLQTPVTFFDLGDTERQKIYTVAFGSWVHDGVNVAAFYTSKELFTSRDTRLLSSWIELSEVLAASAQNAGVAANVRERDFHELIDAIRIAPEDRVDLAININSPGSVLMRAIAQTPLIALALFPLAAAGVPYNQALSANVTATVVGAADNACVGEVQESVRQILRNMGEPKWRRACELARAAAEEATVQAQSRLREQAPARRRPR